MTDSAPLCRMFFLKIAGFWDQTLRRPPFKRCRENAGALTNNSNRVLGLRIL